jgi:hypothetical protein
MAEDEISKADARAETRKRWLNNFDRSQGASFFDGKLVRILIEKLSDVVDLAEKLFPLALVKSHREPSEPVQTHAALFGDL